MAYSRKGYIDWVSGRLELPRYQRFGADSGRVAQAIRARFSGAQVRVEPIYDWVGEEAIPGYEVWVSYPYRHRHLVYSESGKLLRELRVFRADPGIFEGSEPREEPVGPFELFGTNLYRAVKVYVVDPIATPTLSGVSLTNLTGDTQLRSNEFYVQRDQNVSSVSAVDIDPNTDFSEVSGFSELASDYAHTCTGEASECPNQGFDGINVYHHLSQYRERLNNYLAGMGVTAPFLLDPLPVVVNAMRVDFDGDGIKTDETNNAAYYSESCGKDASGNVMNRCLIFLRPAAKSIDLCDGAVQFFDLAREAVVIVHEYQHYVTDTVSAMMPGTLQQPVVGDALHEGYSDYFAASHVSAQSETSVTRIGDYSFANCPALIRDVSRLRVFRNIVDYSDPDTDADPHNSGLSWASGLWLLRSEIGTQTLDKIALKSLFFLSERPSFLEAVDALAIADETLNEGVHAARIREVFYKEVRFVGGSMDVFRDPSNAIVETGLRGCAVGYSSSVKGSAAAFLIWLLVTVGAGWLVRRYN